AAAHWGPASAETQARLVMNVEVDRPGWLTQTNLLTQPPVPGLDANDQRIGRKLYYQIAAGTLRRSDSKAFARSVDHSRRGRGRAAGLTGLSGSANPGGQLPRSLPNGPGFPRRLAPSEPP